MRITMKMFFDQFLSGIQTNAEEMLSIQEQISSNKRVNKPSDDPTAMTRIIGYKKEISVLEQYKRNINVSKDSLQALESSLSSLSSILTRAKELAVKGATGTEDANSRLIMSNEVNVLLESAINIANTKVEDRYVFSGYESDTQPISTTGASVLTDTSSTTIDINLNVSIAANIPANDLFNNNVALMDYGQANFDTDNDQYILRALNFLKRSLENNDQTRVQQAIGFIDAAAEKVFQKTGDIGARLNKIENIETYNSDRDYNLKTYVSKDQDADIAKLVTELAQRQASLEGLRQVSTQFLQTNLFDFIS